MKNLTINQLLDKISDVEQSLMTKELETSKQLLTDIKRTRVKGGLVMVNNTEEILNKIKKCV